MEYWFTYWQKFKAIWLAILSKNKKLVLIETNFFSGGGSKLKSVAGEFLSLNDFLKNEDIIDKFIWVTDGIGWITAKFPLEETFYNNDFIINTKMIFDGVLEEIINYWKDDHNNEM